MVGRFAPLMGRNLFKDDGDGRMRKSTKYVQLGLVTLGLGVGGCGVDAGRGFLSSGSNGSQTSNAGDDDDHADDHEGDGTGAESEDTSDDAETGGPPIDETPTCTDAASVDAGLTKLRRLTREQLDRTIEDLLDIEAGARRTLAPDERIGPFHSNAIAPVTDLLVQQYQELAARIAAQVEPRMAELTPCDLAGDLGTACAIQFVERFGLRAFRRPLAAEEVDGLVALYTLAASSGGPSHGFRRVVEAMLQSPAFLYHGDIGMSGVPSASPEPIDDYGLASRLSYFLWNSMPDDELFELAARGELVERSTLAAQVTRMLQDPRAEHAIALFHRQWLALEGLEDATKNPDSYPGFDQALAAAMLEETDRFSRHVVLEGDGMLSTLLTATYSFPDARLLELYGIAPPDGFTPGDRVELDASERAGILTLPAFLAKHAHSNQSSPIHRGIIVRENLLCQPIPPPPANVAGAPPPPDEITSTRERFAAHVADPTCAGCHAFIDPPGLAFEHYDAIGRYREVDGLGPVDASGELVNVSAALAGWFEDALELSGKLATSEDVGHCVARQWFRFALGRIESASDACSLQEIEVSFQASKGNIRELLTQIVLSDAFIHVRSTATE